MESNPNVSVVIPCYNEEHSIRMLLKGIAEQTLPMGEMELIVVDGNSTDSTRKVVEDFAAQHPEITIRLLENPRRLIPVALNLGINAAKGDVIVRLDAHSVPEPGYIAQCLEQLEQTGAANVGGMWKILPRRDHWMANSIALAAAHPLGAGDARYRTGGSAGFVDTVPFGAYPKEWLEKAGLFEEKLFANEDYEYNYRLRILGGRIWFDPSIRASYLARENLVDLVKQYARYGYWKARMLNTYPRSIRLRQALPPLFVLTMLGLAVLSPFLLAARGLLAIQLSAYAVILLLAGIGAAFQGRHPLIILGFPLATVAIHFAWGLAFLWGIFPRRARQTDQ